jgi:hypothetical protein
MFAVRARKVELPSERKFEAVSEVVAKLGDSTIWTLRKAYGENFAPNQNEDAKLCDVIERLDEASLAMLSKTKIED